MRKFVKTFALPLAIVCGTLTYLLFFYVPALDGFGDWALPVVKDILPWAMGCILFVTFLKLNFHEMGVKKWHVAILLTQLALVVLCVGTIRLFGLDGEPKVLVEGVLVSVICPSAIAASVVAQKLGGNLNQMTTFTLLSNIAAVFTMPVVFPMVELDADISFLSAALVILDKTVKILLLPLFAAAFVKHYLPKIYRRISGVQDLGFYLWTAMLMLVTGVTVRNIVHADISTSYLMAIAFSALGITVVQFALGKTIGGAFGDRIDGGQGLGQKNTTFAIWCAFTYLHPVSSLAPGCYILWQNIVNSWQLWRHERK